MRGSKAKAAPHATSVEEEWEELTAALAAYLCELPAEAWEDVDDELPGRRGLEHHQSRIAQLQDIRRFYGR